MPAATRHYDCHCLLRSTCMSVHDLQDLSCYGFVFGYSRSSTEAQLRLAPNRPCMTLVYMRNVTRNRHLRNHIARHVGGVIKRGRAGALLRGAYA